MDKWFALTLGFILTVIILGVFNTVFAEEYTIEMSIEHGFQPNNGTMTINYGDTITFAIANTAEGHDISNPWLGGHNFLNHDNPSITHSFTTCTSYTFDSTFYILDEVVNVDVINCPEPEVVEVIPTNSTSTQTEEFTPDNPPDNSCGFTGWVEEGDRNVAYRCGQEVASYIIDNPQDNFVGNTQTEQQQTLDLRLQILKVLESIFSILFG
jgi:hypothetical protein